MYANMRLDLDHAFGSIVDKLEAMEERHRSQEAMMTSLQAGLAADHLRSSLAITSLQSTVHHVRLFAMKRTVARWQRASLQRVLAGWKRLVLETRTLARLSLEGLRWHEGSVCPRAARSRAACGAHACAARPGSLPVRVRSCRCQWTKACSSSCAS
jgi:hypothetical protein